MPETTDTYLAYRAQGAILHDGERHEAGDTLELTEAQAQPLLAAGAVKPVKSVKSVKPAGPAGPAGPPRPAKAGGK